MSEDPFDRIIGGSAASQSIREFGRRAAGVDAPVLLLGESGTGKGVLARAIHDASQRARSAFVPVNCAAIPETLFESEFFGHVRGAFTGAQYAHKGLFEQAHGGTLFLDEVGELPLTAQAKLLTTIEDRVVRRVGGERLSQIDVRIIAATACDLHERVSLRQFRTDLLHRINLLCFTLPPLRERGEDAQTLAGVFLERFAARYHRVPCWFDDSALKLVAEHTWPGNVRELAHVVEAAVVRSEGHSVSLEDILPPIAPLLSRGFASPEEQHQLIELALLKCNGNKTRAAKMLGMGRTTLWSKLKRSIATDVQANDTERSE